MKYIVYNQFVYKKEKTQFRFLFCIFPYSKQIKNLNVFLLDTRWACPSKEKFRWQARLTWHMTINSPFCFFLHWKNNVFPLHNILAVDLTFDNMRDILFLRWSLFNFFFFKNPYCNDKEVTNPGVLVSIWNM